jgi:hypothetical protein
MATPYPIWVRIFVGHYFAARSLALKSLQVTCVAVFTESARGAAYRYGSK